MPMEGELMNDFCPDLDKKLARRGRPPIPSSVRRMALLGGASKSGVSQANVVRKYAPELVENVEAGTSKLWPAYCIARERKAAHLLLCADFGYTPESSEGEELLGRILRAN
jgi:hypothetical protein